MLAEKPLFESELSEAIDIPDIATGLSVTAYGGEILFIQATRMPGKGELTITGEVTLRGRVLPVGGIKIKVLRRAHRAGLHAVILPKRNDRDLDDLPEEVRREMTFRFVDRVNDAFSLSLHAGDNHAVDIN